MFPLTSWAQAATGAGWQGTEPHAGREMGAGGEQSGRRGGGGDGSGRGADKRLRERLCLKDERRERRRHPQGEDVFRSEFTCRDAF